MPVPDDKLGEELRKLIPVPDDKLGEELRKWEEECLYVRRLVLEGRVTMRFRFCCSFGIEAGIFLASPSIEWVPES